MKYISYFIELAGYYLKKLKRGVLRVVTFGRYREKCPENVTPLMWLVMRAKPCPPWKKFDWIENLEDVPLPYDVDLNITKCQIQDYRCFDNDHTF